ncbi:DciA family protein [Ottowia testudinis]|uniref:DUF721 domain-containing protein n=1 Tax=Ottowia testudinis TaxID=2816950 RepID=A0A975CGN4_9BURK|nr:DciA family protein [Ottowia testudinis]QTD46103.1 DUF721 domain-containing protein [Ottowia testudinis]
MTFSTKPALTLQQAVAQAPLLARLGQLAAESGARLSIIQPLLPPALRGTVKPGAPEPDAWTLLVPHNAAAAKLRQMLPTLVSALADAGHPVGAIRIKVIKP